MNDLHPLKRRSIAQTRPDAVRNVLCVTADEHLAAAIARIAYDAGANSPVHVRPSDVVNGQQLGHEYSPRIVIFGADVSADALLAVRAMWSQAKTVGVAFGEGKESDGLFLLPAATQSLICAIEQQLSPHSSGHRIGVVGAVGGVGATSFATMLTGRLALRHVEARHADLDKVARTVSNAAELRASLRLGSGACVVDFPRHGFGELGIGLARLLGWMDTLVIVTREDTEALEVATRIVDEWDGLTPTKKDSPVFVVRVANEKISRALTKSAPQRCVFLPTIRHLREDAAHGVLPGDRTYRHCDQSIDGVAKMLDIGQIEPPGVAKARPTVADAPGLADFRIRQRLPRRRQPVYEESFEWGDEW